MLIYTTPNSLILEERGERVHFGRNNGEILEKADDSLAVLDEEVQLCGEVEFLIGKISFEEKVYLFFVVGSSVAAHYRGTSAAVRQPHLNEIFI